MRVEMMEEGAGEDSSDTGGSGTLDSHVRLTLWRADMLRGTMELDARRLSVRKASPDMGLLLGLPAVALVGKTLERCGDVRCVDGCRVVGWRACVVLFF